MEGVLDILLSAPFWAAAIRIATPLMFGVLGALICERAGVLNLGIEGIFTAGAMAGWITVYAGGSLWAGVGVAALTGAGFGLLLGVLTVPLGLSQHVAGIGVTLLATSLAYFTYRVALPNVATPPRIAPFQPVDIPGLSDLPFLGQALFQQTPLTYLALALFALAAFVLTRTPLGLAIRAVGENPAAVEAQGLDVHRLRLGAVIAGSSLMALGGAFLTMAAFNAFFFEMTGGRGWICIALTVFASWRPGKALLGALLFGAFDAFQLRLRHEVGAGVPGQVFLMLPYLLSIAALIAVARRADYPKALMAPYFKGSGEPMTLDLLVRNATLPDGRAGLDIAVRDGRIAAVERGIAAEAGRVIDAAGLLVSPPFVDAHFHMDATLSLGLPRLNESGTLLEGIALWGELKPLLTPDAVVERALSYCDLAVSQGLLAIRSHVDICDERLLAVDALLDVKRRVAPYLDLQLVAFPQDGYFRSPGAVANLERALDRGVEVVGGIPHFERTTADGATSVRRLCEIAAERGLRVDMHCDETDDPLSRHIETLAAETQRLGLQGRVAGSHLTSMHSMDNYYVSKLIPLMAEAGVAVIANPLINIAIQGRHDTYPKRRGMTRVPELRAAGILCALGHDCVMDPWYALGQADMLEVAAMAVHVGHMTGREAMRFCFEAITTNPARVMGLDGYGLRPGCRADFVLLQAADPIEAIRLKSARLAVVRRGRVIAEAEPRVTRLALEGRPESVDPAAYAPAVEERP